MSSEMVRTQRVFKSPSDTTIYSPVLRKVFNKDVSLIEKISNFVESIRIDTCRDRTRDIPDIPTTPAIKTTGDKTQVTLGEMLNNSSDETFASDTSTPCQDVRCVEHGSTSRISKSTRNNHNAMDSPPDGKQVADQLLVQAEKFKARVEAPKGNYQNLIMPYDYDQLRAKFVKPEGLAPVDNEILFLHNFDQDDEFFHVTSQIDPATRGKIERGEFIDLERLLPRDRNGVRGYDDLNRQLFQLITLGTNTYLEPPASKAGKISSIKKWDQAFRIYAAIYTQANLQRAAEIWQYVYVIHTAAGANPWDNVYYYDINFRELMASKPWCSWGKTYTQGWNMVFNNSTVFGVSSTGASTSTNSNQFRSGSNINSKDWKDDCCWRYNKNKCKRSGSECNYDHRCTYCAGWNHSFLNCRKRQQKNKKFNNKTGGSN